VIPLMVAAWLKRTVISVQFLSEWLQKSTCFAFLGPYMRPVPHEQHFLLPCLFLTFFIRHRSCRPVSRFCRLSSSWIHFCLITPRILSLFLCLYASFMLYTKYSSIAYKYSYRVHKPITHLQTRSFDLCMCDFVVFLCIYFNVISCRLLVVWVQLNTV
jgi:hypothetical protein